MHVALRFGCNPNGRQFIPRRVYLAVLIWVGDAQKDLCYFLELNDCLRVVCGGDGLALEDEISADDDMIGEEQLACDGAINATLLFVGYERFAGKDVIKARFALTRMTMPGMIQFCGMIGGND